MQITDDNCLVADLGGRGVHWRVTAPYYRVSKLVFASTKVAEVAAMKAKAQIIDEFVREYFL